MTTTRAVRAAAFLAGLFGAAAGGRVGAAPVPRDEVAAAVAELADRLKKDATPRRPPAEGDRGYGIYMADLVAGGVTLIASASDTDWPEPFLGSAAWSADGRRIYYDVIPTPGDYAGTVTHVVQATATGLDRGVYGRGNCPEPCPVGREVALLFNFSPPGGRTGIHVVKDAGGPGRPLGVYGIPRWSPDGKDILVSQFGDPTGYELVAVDDGSRRPVVLPGHTFHSRPRWVGGDVIVAVVKDPAKATSVALIDLDRVGRAAVKQTLWRRGDGLPDVVDPASLAYSPAARRGVFASRAKPNRQLYVFEPGKPARPLDPGRTLGKAEDAALSPDGRYALFTDGKRD
jgi:Tol biopolymer transport system component